MSECLCHAGKLKSCQNIEVMKVMWESWSLEKKLKLWKKVEVMKKSLSQKKKLKSLKKKLK